MKHSKAFNYFFAIKTLAILPLFIPFLLTPASAKTLGGNELFTAAAKSELLQRRAYILDQFDKGHFSYKHMPNVGAPFQQEWSLVAGSMTAMALTDLAIRFPETKEESVTYSKRIVEFMLSEDARYLGDLMWNRDPLEDLEKQPAQAWYMAHLGLTIGAYKVLSQDTSFDSLYIKIHQSIIRTIKNSDTPYIETYPMQTFTADNSALYASIALYDKLMETDNGSLIKKWITYTKKEMLDKETGLMKSYVTSDNTPYANSRGSWTGWISYYVPLIDSTFAADQYTRAKRYLFDVQLGFLVLREYPHGVDAEADADSGPVIFGASTSGTVFMLGGAVRQKDYVTVSRLLKTFNFAGMPISVGGKKHFLTAPLVGDIVALAMMSASDWHIDQQ